jgi:hypothetical protein
VVTLTTDYTVAIFVDHFGCGLSSYFFDLDGVLVDYNGGIKTHGPLFFSFD